MGQGSVIKIKQVLLIEDEPNIVEAVSFLLLRDGWQVAAHNDGATAWDKAAKMCPDVIVLDVMLPNKSGYDVLSELRADPATADIPVLMLTARGQAKDRELAMERGANQYMTKPFSNTEVIAAINALPPPGAA